MQPKPETAKESIKTTLKGMQTDEHVPAAVLKTLAPQFGLSLIEAQKAISMLMGNDTVANLKAATQFRKILSSVPGDLDPISAAIEVGLIPRFCELLGPKHHSKLQYVVFSISNFLTSGL